MGPFEITDRDEWGELATYRQRYDIEDRIEPVLSLERSIGRRRARRAGIRRRAGELRRLLTECDAEVEALDGEIAGSERMGALLIRDILDRVRLDEGEAWSPSPIRGYRMWRIEDNTMLGSQQMPWGSPAITARCLRDVPGDDIPHAEARCGPPACGVYATKDLSMFPLKVVQSSWDGYALGVVSLTGKVVEHEQGYRGARASVVGIAARLGDRWLTTARPAHIESLFADPESAMTDLGSPGFAPPGAVEVFLTQWREKEHTWT